MASFASQVSNMQALTLALGSLSKILNVKNDDSSSRKINQETEENVQEFFDTQQRRLAKIENSLYRATGDVLPTSANGRGSHKEESSSMTITELAELCQMVQESNRKQMIQLVKILRAAGHEISFDDKDFLEEFDVFHGQQQHHSRPNEISQEDEDDNNDNSNSNAAHEEWCSVGESTVGAPLESVIEQEVETDTTTTTPGSMGYQSPSFWNTKSTSHKKNHRPKRSITPTTPTMDSFSFSSSTNSILGGHNSNSKIMQEDKNNNNNNNNNIGQFQPSPRYDSSKDHSQIISFYSHPRRSSTKDRMMMHPHHLDAFREEDDMITLDSRSTLAGGGRNSINNHGQQQQHKDETISSFNNSKTNFFSKMESMLEQVEESVLDEETSSRPSDESDSRFRLSSSSFHDQHHKQQRKYGTIGSRPSDEYSPVHNSTSFRSRLDDLAENENNDEDEGEEDTYGDDSTNVVATVVAADRSSNPVNVPRPPEPVPFFSGQIQSPDVKRPQASAAQRPTDILVNTDIPSPAHTNITMDNTMINFNDNNTVTTYSVAGDVADDNSSTMTPVLDRYRLDPDDNNSIGVKVVPNQRGYHRPRPVSRNHSRVFESRGAVVEPRTPLPTVYSSEKPREVFTPLPESSSSSRSQLLKTPLQQRTNLNTPMSLPAGLPANISARKKKQYRKTPHPKQSQKIKEETASESQSNATIDEQNRHPNHSAAIGRKSKTSFSIPPLRPRSIDQKQNKASDIAAARKLSVSGDPNSALDTSTGSTTPLMDAFLKKHSISSATTKKVDESFVSFKSSSSIPTLQEKWIEKITMAEYDAAPSIVRTQVSRGEVNDAAALLESYFTQEQHSSLEITLEKANSLLSPHFGSKDKCKGLLMSLCHWRRMLMYRDDRDGMIFSVKQFEQ